jgi:hypothetical protein
MWQREEYSKPFVAMGVRPFSPIIGGGSKNDTLAIATAIRKEERQNRPLHNCK